MSFTSRIRNIKDNILLRGLSASDFVLSRINTGVSAAGKSVTADSALKVSAVYACVKVLAETIASLPLMVYERDGEGKKPAPEHPLFPLLHDSPNDYQTSFEWREGLVAHVCLRGNSYHRKVEDSKGELLELIPMNPANMEVAVENGKPVYTYTYEDRTKEHNIRAEKVWHIKNMPISCSYGGDMPEGVVGASPISLARESIGLALAADDYGGRYFSNMASVGMAITFPDGVSLGENAKTYLRESLAEYGKAENKFKSIILEKGGKLEKIGMSNQDSQFLESRQFEIEEIARIFRVPPILIGHPTNTMTYASAEQLFLAFATYTIRPWCVRIEQSINRYLISRKDRGRYFVEFNLAGLLRGDTVSRFQAYSTARQWGWLNVDEIRGLENMNPLPEGKGKLYLQPMNMVEAGTEPKPEPKIQPEDDEIEGKQKAGGNDNA